MIVLNLFFKQANLHANSLTGKYRGITTIIFENNKN
jgi:hypothetical protein